MFAEILGLALALVAVQAQGDLAILHSPDSVQFSGKDEVTQSTLADVLSASLGYTPKQRGTWHGMSISDPFNLPEAVVAIAIEGVGSMPSSTGIHYSLNVDEVEETTWQALSGRLAERDNSNTLIRIYLGDGVDALGHSVLGELKLVPIDESSLKSLSSENEVDRKVLEEIQLLDAIAAKVPSAITADNKPDVYWFVLSAFQAFLDFHGDDSPAAKEAFTLLNAAFSRLSHAFMEVYGEKVLVVAFTNEASHIRHTRAVTSEGVGRADDNVTGQSSHKTIESTTEAKLGQNLTESYEKKPRVLKSGEINISKAYDEDYPVMFNIFLWFGVAFLFSLIAVCIVIADMDPGRDSIIYRMTSNRMKKDN